MTGGHSLAAEEDASSPRNGGTSRPTEISSFKGSCADAVKLALCSIVEVLPPGAVLVHTVHDEIAVECDQPDAAAVRDLLQECMEDSARTIFKGDFPAEVVVAQSWGDKP